MHVSEHLCISPQHHHIVSNRSNGRIIAHAGDDSFLSVYLLYCVVAMYNMCMGKCKFTLQRVIEVEHATFTPIVLSTTGGWGPSASIVFKRLASMISEKHSSSYSSTMKIIHSKVAFSLIDLAIMCLRGARSSFHRPVKELNLIDNPTDLMVNEGQI